MHPLLAQNELKANVALLDSDGTIIGVNDNWRQFARANGCRLPDDGVGASYFSFCPRDASGDALRRDLENLVAGKVDVVAMVYSCHSPVRLRWFVLIGLRATPDDGAALLHIDLTEFFPRLTSGDALRSVVSSGTIGDPITLDAIAKIVSRSIQETLGAEPLPRALSAPSAATPTEWDAVQTKLTARQWQVLVALGEGKSNAEIAVAFGLSPNTVKLHVSAILRSLSLSSRTQAALLAAKLTGVDAKRGAPLSTTKRDPRRRTPRG